MWDDLNDAQMRANYTVVRLHGRPVYITRVRSDAGIYAEYMDLLSGDAGKLPIKDPGWDWSPVPTGFVNAGSRVYYVQRKPCRKYKQGLSKDNCSVYPQARNMDVFKTKQFGQTVMRDYPSYAEALASMSVPRQVAFHPDFALSRSKVGPVYLVYRTDVVGWYEAGEIVLGDEWKFLKELVSEVTHVNA
jgi:hypothetical protein